MNYIDALALLGNAKRAEGTQVRHAGNASYTKVEVVGDSEDGVAVVNPGGMVLSSDDSQYIEVETIGAVSEGDMADALLVGDDNSGKTMLLVGSVGSGDKQNLRIAAIEADYIKTEQLEAATARIGDLEADHVSVSDFEAEQASIDTLQASTADIDTIRANAAKVANLTAAELEADHATVGALDATYAQINLANVDNAWIQNGTVKDGAITNAMINSVSANKLTAGTIDASAITVTNLNADNITTGTINGQRIGEGSLSLSKLEDDVYTETEVDGIVQNLQSQIDGAIETWTGADVPTLQNAPAVNWDTDSIKDTHVGDVYFVVNSQSQQNGYNYRFTKTGNVYSWQLIKDNDVTNALQRLTDAEGRIGTIETFDTTVSSFMTNTDAELTSIKTAATTLEGRVDTAEGTLATKVDTSTFNTLSQTVDGNTSSIQQLSVETTTLTKRVDDIDEDITVVNAQEQSIIIDTNVRAAVPKELEVRGFSVQESTTGKNLLSYANEDWGTFRMSGSSNGTIVASGGYSRRYYALPLEPGETIHWYRNGLAKFSGYFRYCTTYPPEVGASVYGGVTATNYASYNFVNSTEDTISLLLVISSKPTEAAFELMDAQLEYGTAFTEYERYSGGVPSPSPEWPVAIETVDALTLHFISGNLLDASMLEQGTVDANGANGNNTTRIRTKLNDKIPVLPNVIYRASASIEGASCKYWVCWLDENGYRFDTAVWYEAGEYVIAPEEARWARVLFGRDDDAALTVADLSDIWFGAIETCLPHTEEAVTIDLQGHSLRKVYDVAQDKLIFTQLDGNVYSVTLHQETDATVTAASDGLDVTIGVNALSSTGRVEDGATVVYCLPAPIDRELGTITLPLLASPDIYVYGKTSNLVNPELRMAYWALSIRSLIESAIEQEITTAARVNEVSDTVDEHTRRLGALETTVETKADGSEVTTISNKLNTVSDTVNEHTQTITSVQSTINALGTRVSTAESSITQNAENIELKVSKDGVISSINQSSESVKIQASKIEIDGTAIFTNEDFREAADAAYASKASEALIESANTNANNALQTALDGAFLVLTSTNGQLFKNGTESTILQVAIFPNGGTRCDTIEQVRSRFGSAAYIEWKWMHESSGEWGTLISTDPHLSRGGMWLTVSPEDVATKTTFAASLVVPD